MRKIILVSLVLISLLPACKKDKVTKVNESFDSSNATLLSQACIETDAHTTSGMVKLYSKNGEKILVFEDFSTEAGPDLNVFLSSTTLTAGATDLGDLKGEKGNFYYTLDINTPTDSLNSVLIWCVQYSVLFGHSTLLK